MNSFFSTKIATVTNLPEKNIINLLQLFEEDATIPFISRYRKEATGNMDEVQISEIKDLFEKFKALEERRQFILESIKKQEKLTPELEAKIKKAETIEILEDLYLPYKPKKRTRAQIAIEKGLEPLATLIFKEETDNPLAEALLYLNDEVDSPESALAGARDIMAEWINEKAEARETLRTIFAKEAFITSKLKKKTEKEAQKYQDYFDYKESLNKSSSHRLLAIRRGENEGFLRVAIDIPNEEEALNSLEPLFIQKNNASSGEIEDALKDSFKRLLHPAIETEYAKLSKEIADKEAINVFGKNLRQLLLGAPLGSSRILALDPGFRTGCKTVCLDEKGTLLYNTTIFPHPPQNKQNESLQTLEKLIQQFEIEAIAIGNGTASRETEQLARKLSNNIPVFVVSEDGASIYSASAIAREEFPNEDVTVRGAISIGRRLMDPLSELVKIDPKSIGVGQYQHDVDQKALKKNLDEVVESCVNLVGVNLNTASPYLLSYIAGLNIKLAQNIVKYREEKGAFTNRKQLKKVPRIGEKTWEQCIGFLRIPNGDNPLDNSAVHPESYALVEKMAKDLDTDIPQLLKEKAQQEKINLENYLTETVGLPTLEDIYKELQKPGRDPREQKKSFSFDPNIKTIDDLKENISIPGIVTNITNFGAFIDLGIKEKGLLHISQMADRYVSDPNAIVSLGQELSVKIVEIDKERKRIALSLI